MELFWLDSNLPWRNISSVIKKITDLWKSKTVITLNVDWLLELSIDGKPNAWIADKINGMLKSKITKWEIVNLLKLLNVSWTKWKLWEKELNVLFSDNKLILSDEAIIALAPEKKETKIKTSNTLDYSGIESFTLKKTDDYRTQTKWDMVNDLLSLLWVSVIFASDNGIWDIVITQWDFLYFIKWEENIHDNKLEWIIKKILWNTEFTWLDVKFFFEQMISLSASKEEDKDDAKEYKETLQATLKEKWTVDFSVKVEWRKLRVNFSYSNGKKLSAVMRVIESGIPPKMEDLWLIDKNGKSAYRDVLSFPFGLILIVWPTGSWKSFSLTSMRWEINRTMYKHIITLEDPIEFEHDNVLSKIEQKEVWVDIVSYAVWLKWILRQKPHIAVCWEIRDWEVMEKALELAATGHVVFATFHANDVLSTIQRITDFFPVEKQLSVLQQLWEFILWIFVQKLVSREGGWKVLIKEIMVQTENIKNSIMRNDMKTLVWYIEAGWKYWMYTNDQSIEMLWDEGLISQKTAVDFAKDKPTIKRLTGYDEYAEV